MARWSSPLRDSNWWWGWGGGAGQIIVGTGWKCEQLLHLSACRRSRRANSKSHCAPPIRILNGAFDDDEERNVWTGW